MAPKRSSTLRLILITAVLLAMFDSSRGWLWSRRRRRQRVSAPTSKSFHYNRSTALRMMHYSTASYARRQKIDSWSCPSCQHIRKFSDRSRFDRGWGTRALVGYDHTLHSIVIAFRGTNNTKNMIGNFLAWRRRFPYGSGKVHYGMLKMYNAIRGAVLDRVKQILSHYERRLGGRVVIHVTGHSLGGALATMAAVELKRRYPHNQLIMYNFGSPRVGDASFVRDYARRVTKSIRFVNKADPITIIPTRWMGYRHVPREVKLSGWGHSKYLGVSRRRK